MNREQAKELLPVITAWIEGKNVQFKYRDTDGWTEWQDYDYSPDVQIDSHPAFDSNVHKWRIKPEVKKGWINIYPNLSVSSCVYVSKEEAGKVFGAPDRIACIKITYTEGEGL